MHYALFFSGFGCIGIAQALEQSVQPCNQSFDALRIELLPLVEL